MIETIGVVVNSNYSL